MGSGRSSSSPAFSAGSALHPCSRRIALIRSSRCSVVSDGASFTSTATVPQSPSVLKIAYKAHVTDVAALQTALQAAADARAGSPGSYSIQLQNTADFDGTAKTATVTPVAATASCAWPTSRPRTSVMRFCMSEPDGEPNRAGGVVATLRSFHALAIAGSGLQDQVHAIANRLRDPLSDASTGLLQRRLPLKPIALIAASSIAMLAGSFALV